MSVDLDVWTDGPDVVIWCRTGGSSELSPVDARRLVRNLIASIDIAEGHERSAMDDAIVGLSEDGRSIREIAAELDVTIHRVRKAIDKATRV